MIFHRSLQPVRAITFDLDDTLYDNHPLMVQAEQRLMDFMHQHYPTSRSLSLQDWRAIKKQWLKQRPELASDMGLLRRLTLQSGLMQAGLSEQQAIPAAEQCFERFYFYRSDFEINKNIHSTLAKLASRVPLVAITNGNVNLQQIGLDSYFSACFKANIKQPMKPHRSMFDLAQQHLGLPAKHILHVGDNLEKDIMGAMNAGFQSAWHACNRPMIMTQQSTTVLPHVSIFDLAELETLVVEA